MNWIFQAGEKTELRVTFVKDDNKINVKSVIVTFKDEKDVSEIFKLSKERFTKGLAVEMGAK